MKVGLVLCGLVAAIYAAWLFTSGRWPPNRLSLWSVVEIWGVSSVVILSVYGVGAMDRGCIPMPGWIGGLGLAVTIAGNILANLGIVQLGLARTSGAPGPRITHGLYRFMGHPQYLGHGAALMGWVLYTGSCWAIPQALAALFCLGLAARAETQFLCRAAKSA